MLKFLSQNKISLLYFISLLITSAFLFPIWSLMLIAWFGLYFLMVYRKDFKSLNTKELKFWKIIVFAYPLFETFIKAMINFNVIPYSWRWLNIAEHIGWAICMYLILLPYTKELTLLHHRFIALILSAGIVIIFGNLNELLEFSFRAAYGYTSERLFALYYTDTTIDIMNNLIGAVLGAITSYFVLKKDSE